MDETSQGNIKRTATPRATLNLVPFRQKSRKIHDFVYPQKIFHNQSHATGVCQNCLYILRYKINSLVRNTVCSLLLYFCMFETKKRNPSLWLHLIFNRKWHNSQHNQFFFSNFSCMFLNPNNSFEFEF